MNLLKDKNILIGITGSIAIYKSLELIRLYIKAGANVKVIMTAAAKKFINPITFETISQNKVLDDTNEDWSFDTQNNHIAIVKWADIFVLNRYKSFLLSFHIPTKNITLKQTNQNIDII